MRLQVTLLCPCCGLEGPKGVFDDMRIGRALLAADARRAGWRVRRKKYEPYAPELLCCRDCYNRNAPWKTLEDRPDRYKQW